MNRERFVVSSGSTAIVRTRDEWTAQDRDAVVTSLDFSTPSSAGCRVDVNFTQPPIIRQALDEQIGEDFDESREAIAYVAALDEFDTNVDFPEPEARAAGEPVELTVDSEKALFFFEYEPGSISNRELRRFIARRAYASWAENDLSTPFSIDRVDMMLTRVRNPEFARNIEILIQDGEVVPLPWTVEH